MTHDPREALEPCPFCGTELDIDRNISDTGVYWVMCHQCCAEGPPVNPKAEAIKAWNTRALTASPGEQKPVERYSIEFDGFTGTVIGSYTTLEGKDGVVLQQDGTRVVHVYGRKHLKPAVSTGDEAKKSEGGRLPTNLAEIIETELTAWRGANGGVYTIHAAALGISCAIRSAVFSASNMKSEGGSREQPFDPADAAGVKSGTVTFDGQTGRPNRDEVGASQTPGSSMSFAADKPIAAKQALRPSDPTAERREIVARAICKSGKLETGQGTCAVLCMDQLGDVRKKGCGHCIRVHAKLADAILAALDGGACA